MSKPLDFYKPIKCAASDTRLYSLDESILVGEGMGYEGDLILVESLSSKGAYAEIEDLNGRSMKIYKGQKFVAILGNRESSKNLVGGIPNEGIYIDSHTVLHLLTNGGIVGNCDFSPYYMGDPLELRCLGLLNKDGKRMNSADNVQDWCLELGSTAPIILVAGTATDAGKTTITSNIISILVNELNYDIAGCKLAGTGCLEDILAHKDAGAKWIADFPDVGLPSTYTSEERYMKGTRTLLHELNKHNPDFIIGELGGDIIWANIPTLLKMPDVMKNVIGIVLVPLDTLSVIGSLKLMDEWNVQTPVYIINSPFRNERASQMRIEKYVKVDSYSATNLEDLRLLTNKIIESCKLLS